MQQAAVAHIDARCLDQPLANVGQVRRQPSLWSQPLKVLGGMTKVRLVSS